MEKTDEINERTFLPLTTLAAAQPRRVGSKGAKVLALRPFRGWTTLILDHDRGFGCDPDVAVFASGAPGVVIPSSDSSDST